MAGFEGKKVVILVGGVGGAKLAYGLSQCLSADQLTIIVNVADDFWYYGLRICPDADTLMYTLSGLVDPVNGWGVGGDTRQMLTALNRLGETPWFGLGDQDLATHLVRTHLLREGWRLTDVTRRLNKGLGVDYPLLPVTDDPVATIVDTLEHGELGFQTYFVRHRWQPTVRSLRYDGITDAKVTPEVRAALENADVVIFGPSNPWLSIQPILDVPGVREILKNRAIPRIAVTPIIGGEAVKGPAAKLMREMGLNVSAEAVAQHYGDMINGFVDDEVNPDFELEGIRIKKFNTLMVTNQDKINLAYKMLELVKDWI